MKNIKINQQSGQALIELIIFLPIMLILYSVISGFANAINGSINQQKVARAYFYNRVMHNSTIPKPGADGGVPSNWNRFGMFFIGWMDRFSSGDSPLMPCYKVTIPMNASGEKGCGESYSKKTTQFIRVGTVYGMCGATFVIQNSQPFFLPDVIGADYASVTDEGSCLIQ
jgi:hypothetical protein